MADTLPLPELIAALQRLDRLDGPERERLARELSAVARASLRADADATTYRMTRAGMTQPEVAARLGIGLRRVERAVTNHTTASTERERTASRRGPAA
jgi:hypothetical protein